VGAQALDPLDLFDIRSELTDDEVMVKDTVGRFVDDRVIPLMREAFEKHEFPHHLIREVAELGLLGSSIDGYDCAGLNSVSYGLICQELERGDSGLRSFVSVQSSLVMFRTHRAAWRFRPGQHENAREARRRRLDHQRVQNVDHQRNDCGCGRGLGQDR
jgi:alkylation response protein AidB-like acyl-CoA dehydrogenase